jgi:hypothetical protein
VVMALKPALDPELALVVERARRRAAAAGELEPSRAGTAEAPLAPEARVLVQEWLRDGGYDRAVALVVADDPELAIQ